MAGYWTLNYNLWGNNHGYGGVMNATHGYEADHVNYGFSRKGPWVTEHKTSNPGGRVKLKAKRGVWGGGWGVVYYLQVDYAHSAGLPVNVSVTLRSNHQIDENYAETFAAGADIVSELAVKAQNSSSVPDTSEKELWIKGSRVVTENSSFLQNFAQLSSGNLNLSSGSISTSSTTGALTVTGGIGVGMDSYINGIRIGRGGGDVGSNTAIGERSLPGNSTGAGNTSVGSQALMRNTTGYRNSSFGVASLHFNTSGSWNAAFGVYSLYKSSGHNNTGMGNRSLFWMSSGNNNTALGYQAGEFKSDYSNLTSSDNGIYIGAYTKPAEDGNVNSIVIGYGAVGEGSNTTVIGNSQTVSSHIYGETKAESLRVVGSAVLEGQVILEVAQGDISMGAYE